MNLKHPDHLTLYPFQKETIIKTLNFFAQNTTHSAYVASSPGLGKSITTIVTANTMGAERILIVCPSVMRLVWESEINTWSYQPLHAPPSIKVVLTSADVLDTHEAKWVIISYDLIWRPEVLKVLEEQKFSLLVGDENHYCCHEDTLINTPSGKSKIKSINAGDKVLTICNNAVEEATVLKKIDGLPSKICEFKFSDGSYLNCLDWHLILDSSGNWQEAYDIQVSDKVSTVWEDVGSSVSIMDEKKVLLSGVLRESVFRKPSVEEENERVQSYEKPRSPVEDEKNPEENWAQTSSSGRERETHTRSSESAEAVYGNSVSQRGSGDRVSDSDVSKSRERLSCELQSGLFHSSFDALLRGRWTEPFGEGEKAAGQEKRYVLAEAGVESVKVSEPINFGAPGNRYYDLMLDKGHNYFANGVVVHNCKSKSKRTACFFKKLWPLAKHHLLLSGTPFTTNVVDCYRPFHYIAPEVQSFQSLPTFVANYSYEQQTPWGTKYFGLKNAELLSRIIREKFFIRYRKEEVLTQLPPVQYTRVYLPVEYALKMSERMDNATGWEKQAVIDAILHDMQPKISDSLATMRRMQGEVKVPAVVEYAQDLLEQDIPIVIFAHHKSVIEGIRKGLEIYTPAVITGETSAASRQEAIDAFQGGETNLIICNLVAGGVGITLTRSNNVLLAEAAWTAAENQQAISRCHRIGTKGAVVVHWFVVKDSIDEDILNVVMRRTREFSKVFDENA